MELRDNYRVAKPLSQIRLTCYGKMKDEEVKSIWIPFLARQHQEDDDVQACYQHKQDIA